MNFLRRNARLNASEVNAVPTLDPLWFKDAVFYELHVKAFYDGNDDGIGDFRGLIQKLDYLEWLGVTCLCCYLFSRLR